MVIGVISGTDAAEVLEVLPLLPPPPSCDIWQVRDIEYMGKLYVCSVGLILDR